MTIAHAKGVSAVSSPATSAPLTSTGKASGSEATNPSSPSGVLDSFFASQSGSSPTANASSDPLAALRAMLEDQSVAVPDHPVPTIEEIMAESMASDPAGTTWIDGTIEGQYAQLKFEYQTTKQELLNNLKNSSFRPSQLATIQKTIAELDNKILQIDAEVARVRTVAGQFRATYTQEEALLKQYGRGEITAEKCDLNKDGVIGNPLTSDYVIGNRIIDGVSESAVLLKSTGKPVRFDAEGNALEGNVLNPKYTWTPGADDTTGMTIQDTADGTITMQVTTTAASGTGAKLPSYAGSGNEFQAQIVVPVPESLWVEVYADGTPKTTVDDDGNERMKPYNKNGNFTPGKTEQDSGTWKQIKITDVNLRSDTENPPAGFTEGEWDPQKDGTNQIVEFKVGDAVVMQMRIEGPEVNEDTGLSYPASSFTLALWGGDGANARRTEPVNVEVDSGYISTSYSNVRTANFEHGDAKTSHWKEEGKFSDDHSTIKNRTGEYFTGAGADSENSFAAQADIRNGVMMMGLRGNLVGSKYNDLFDVLPPNAGGHAKGADATKITSDSPLYRTTIDAGEGFNAVFAQEGDHYIRGATFVNIDGDNGDINHVKLNNIVNVTDNDGQERILNAATQVRIDAPHGDVFVDNSHDVLVLNDDLAEDNYDNGVVQEESDEGKFELNMNGLSGKHRREDDQYEINSGKVGVGNTDDSDLTRDLKTVQFNEAVTGSDDFDSVFSEMQTEVVDELHHEAADQDEGMEIEENAWKMNAGEYYTKAVDSMNSFFSSYRQHTGMPAEGSTDDDEVGKALDDAFGAAGPTAGESGDATQ